MAEEEDDLEAEMLRMMQEEVEGDGAEPGEAEEAGDDLTGLEALAGGEDADGGSIDEMLEQEMLKAMEGDDTPDPMAGAMSAFGGGEIGAATSDPPEGIEKLSDVDVTVTVELGGNVIAIKDIMEWQTDAIVELEPQEHEPVDVLVNGQLYAKGEVVVVGDTFGVRIIELVEQSDEPTF